jgi:hypothetical protein
MPKCQVKGCDNPTTNVMLSHNDLDHDKMICDECLKDWNKPKKLSLKNRISRCFMKFIPNFTFSRPGTQWF